VDGNAKYTRRNTMHADSQRVNVTFPDPKPACWTITTGST
jgi:hypothetical protein